ncbi:cysteine desulfurase NifS [Candidatus Beckwithbacteria bacterium CG10_big_fil_rev_8_21_14_0_10_34_10]|uniref:cysteine desulfurase n=1 Tax=Candidatus Beckwithbacteria bacterium CG10_big_fil_rev_8_21_14_0_10_34_10 TaxID=1974495 RepID=A0A2H0WB33_9BACT|nr:MAG: cysteine desulfurase NifS [Candidatus Beckwithbacteria bacterium CG10_big_fil_rev_8_21_14_0_10_34_10]
MKKIYLDYAATSPVDSLVLKTMSPYGSQFYGNPNSLHSWGQKAREAVEKSRQIIAKYLNCLSEEIIFTSCATEANNLALKGVVKAWKEKNLKLSPHIIVSPIEHHCVLDTAKRLAKEGVEVSWLKVDKTGLVDPKQVEKLIKKNTILVSVMDGNNEVGTIEPIKEIGKIIKNKKGKGIYPLFHTDAVQAIQYLSLDTKKLKVDLLSASAHKFYGPKGIGFLYLKKGTPIVKEIEGGSQENNLRAGTENVSFIVGMAKALDLVRKNKDKEVKRLEFLRDYFIKKILKNIPQTQLTGHPKARLPHIASFVFLGAEGEAILLYLNDKGIGVSSGSACTSGSLKPSHVLLAMRIKPEIAHGSIRFSFGKKTTRFDLDYVLKVLPGIIKKIRKMAPKLKIGK